MNNFNKTRSLMKSVLFSIILFLSFGAYSQHDYTIRLKSGSSVISENFTNRADINLSGSVFNGRSYMIIQFYDIPDFRALKELKDLDVKLLEYIPQNAYIVSLPILFDFNKLISFNIRSLLAIEDNLKIGEPLRELIETESDQLKEINIVLHSFNDISNGIIENELRKLHVQVIKSYENYSFVVCRIPVNKIKYLARLPFVCFIEKQSPPGHKEDQGARALHRSSTIDNNLSNGLNYDGTGVNVVLRDDGRIGPHIDYKSRLDQSLCYSNIGYSTHGDMVSGILIGAGNLDPDVTGAARGAFLYTLEYEAEFMDETLMLHTDKNVTLTNSSYSDGCNDGYTANAYTTDEQIHDHPGLMHVFSSGNMGNTDCNYGAGTLWGNITGGHKMGKNSICVGNVNELGELQNNSSRGPATDGRIKPELCAQGSNQLSTYPNNEIDYGGGTSAACPGVTGALAQLTQVFKELNNGNNPPSALLKACLLNTATDIAATGPDFATGWGIVNAFRAYKVLNKKNYWSDNINQNEINSQDITVPAGTKRLNVMVYWADEPASVMASKALVNDLDMVISDPQDKKYLPWVLDITAVSDSLAKPAIKGIDHLNNMEQVSIDVPAAGNYKVDISGFSVPFGAQDYWVVYEIIPDTPKLVFPIGGESFKPKELLNIQWDAAGDEGDFTLDYSLDKQNWTFIKKVKGNLRRAYWQTLFVPTERVWLRLSRNGKSDIMEQPYTIIKRVDSLKVSKTCPDFVELTWEHINSASNYIVYKLGQKYMEVNSIVSDTFITISSNNAGDENWFAVQPVWFDGVRGKRSKAIKVQNLTNCKQAVDLALQSSGQSEISGVYCENELIPIKITIRNDGLNTISSYTLKISTTPGSEVVKQYNDVIIPGGIITKVIDTIYAVQTGSITINVIVNTPGESAFFNDTLKLKYNLQVQAISGFPVPVIEGFENSEFPPPFWQVIDTLFDVKWDRISCTGSDGKPTRVAYMNNFSNPATGSYDDMITARYDLTNQSAAYLLFDLAYAVYDPSSFQDSLEVSVSTDCGKTFPYQLYYDGGETMQTAGIHDDQFIPTKASDWKIKAIDLNSFLGQSISIRFRNISGYGNSIYLDNIKILNKIDLDAKILEFDSIGCINVPINFYAKSTPAENYIWDFGTGATPQSTTGQGPHIVTYSTPGLKEVKLFVNGFNDEDSSILQISIEPTPNADFAFAENGKQYLFNSLSEYPGWQHFWTFGDGNVSNEENPIHTYLTSGNYTVVHKVMGYCGESTKNKTIILTAVNDIENQVLIYPNPVTNLLNIKTHKYINTIEIIGLNGQKVFSKTYDKVSDLLELDLSQLPAGMYFIKILTGNRWILSKVSKL